jgi:hypothetical protein
MLVGKAALHRDHPAGVDIHRHESALHLGHLAQGPADETAVTVCVAADMTTSPTFRLSESDPRAH